MVRVALKPAAARTEVLAASESRSAMTSILVRFGGDTACLGIAAPLASLSLDATPDLAIYEGGSTSMKVP